MFCVLSVSGYDREKGASAIMRGLAALWEAPNWAVKYKLEKAVKLYVGIRRASG